MALEAQTLVPIVAALGFGVQQFSQVIVDPVSSAGISFLKNHDRFGKADRDGVRALKGGISDVDAKKVIMGFSSILIGLIVVSQVPSIRVLEAAGLMNAPTLDPFITALTIGAGTEGANSVMKIAQYLKDAVKTKTAPSVAQSSPVPQFPTDTVRVDVDEDDREFDA